MLNNLVLSKLNDFHPIKQIGHNQPCMNTIQLQFYTGTEIILVVTCQGSWNTIFVQGINAVHHYKSLCNGIVRASLNPFILTFVSYSAKLCQIIYVLLRLRVQNRRKNGISHLISGLCVNCLSSIPEYSRLNHLDVYLV